MEVLVLKNNDYVIFHNLKKLGVEVKGAMVS
jgi:hypothetical protein